MDGYRLQNSLRHGYLWREAGREVCRVTGDRKTVEQVAIRGLGFAWESRYDRQNTLFPGLRRAVCDAETGEQIGCVIYDDDNNYELIRGPDRVMVKIDDGTYVFRRKDRRVAVIHPDGGVTPEESFFDAYPKVFSVMYDQGEDPAMLLMMLSLPRLRMA